MTQAMDEVFFITGAGTGIGRVTARYLLLKGFKVFLTDSNPDFLKETCTEHFPSVLPLDKQQNYKWAKMDVTEDEDVKTAVAACIDAFGRMDVLMNNAGINSQYTRQGIRMDAAPTSDFVKVLSTNLIGTYRVSQHSIQHLEKSPNGGVIINLSSCRATQASPHGEAYAASKAGINGLTMSMAISLGPKIRVHSLSPGFVDVRFERSERLLPEREKLVGDLQADYLTEYVPEWGFGESPGMGPAHPVGRFGRGEDVARWVEFLGVGEGGFTTGGEFMVDGGYSKVLSYPK